MLVSWNQEKKKNKYISKEITCTGNNFNERQNFLKGIISLNALNNIYVFDNYLKLLNIF